MSWILGVLPGLNVAIGAVGDGDKKGQIGNFATTPLQILTSVFGVVSTVTGCLGNHYSSSTKDSDYYEDVVNIIANDITPLLLKDIVDSSESTSLLVACGLTFGIDLLEQEAHVRP